MEINRKCIHFSIFCILLGMIIFIFISVMIFYVVYSILSLSSMSNNQVMELCPNSSLWVYVFVYLIVNMIRGLGIIKKTIDLKTMGVMLIISIVFTGWGLNEVFIRSCSVNLSFTKLYNLSIFCVFIEMCFLISIIIIIIIYGVIPWLLGNCKSVKIHPSPIIQV
jgi:hypothetical protein